MVTKDDLYSEVLRQNAEIRELKEHLAIMYVDAANAEWKLNSTLDVLAEVLPVDSQEGTD